MTKKTGKKPIILSTSDHSMKKSRKKPTILSTPDDSMKKPTMKKKMEKAQLPSPPAMKKTKTTKKLPHPGGSRYGFLPRTSRSAKACVGVRLCKYCKRSFYYLDLSQHKQCCYRAILNKEELELIEDEDDGKVGWLNGGDGECTATHLAKQGLKHLNTLQKGGPKYKIVRPGPFYMKMIGYGPIAHFNFKAKANNSDLIETFFCQLRKHNHYYDSNSNSNSNDVIDVFIKLGPSSELPWANLQDCTYCKFWVHHPPDLTDSACNHLIRGLIQEDVVWLYGKNISDPSEYDAIRRREFQAKAAAAVAAKDRRASRHRRLGLPSGDH